jgi:putative acetyltransferase
VAPILRLAREEDAPGIHAAHMASIRESCAADYTPAQIDAWAGRTYREDLRRAAIRDDAVWVLDDGGEVVGYAHLAKRGPEAELVALYFRKRAAGLGLGRALVEQALQRAREWGCSTVALNSTLTSLRFYQRLGFVEVNPANPVVLFPLGEVSLECVPMCRSL